MREQNQGHIHSYNLPHLAAEEDHLQFIIGGNSSQKQMAKALVIGAINQIQEEIINQNLIIRSQPTREFLMPVSHKNPQNLKLSQIIKKKQELNLEMARLKYEESKVKQKKRNSTDKYYRSSMTKEEIQSINHVLSQQKRFQQQQQLKLKQLQEDISAEEEAKRQQLKQKLQQKTKNKHLQAIKHIEMIKTNQALREKTIKKHNSNYQSIKNKQFLYQQIEKKWKRQKEDQQLREEMILQNSRKQKEFNIDKIIQHEKNHKIIADERETIIKQREKEIKKKRQEMAEQISNHYPSSKFLSILVEEQKQQQMEEQEKEQQFRAHLQKKIKYSATVREVNRQHIQQSQVKLQNNPSSMKNINHKTTRSLSLVELAKLGNTYMRQVHSSMDRSPKPKNTQRRQKFIFKYQNYLSQIKNQRMAKEQNNPETKQLRELKSVMKKQAPLKQKLYLAKLISNKLESKAGNDARLLLQSINAKLSIINQFSQK